MPTYDYKCTSCKHTWEEFQAITAKATKKCPACGKSKAQRVIGPGAGIIFKGSGFYQTDYRSAAYKKDAAADQKTTESAKPESKSETKSETKSDSSSKSSSAE